MTPLEQPVASDPKPKERSGDTRKFRPNQKTLNSHELQSDVLTTSASGLLTG